jgi:S-layer family protein
MKGENMTIRGIRGRAMLLLSTMILITSVSIGLRADTGTCGGQTITLPFTDVPSSNIFFCAIAEAYFSGITNGTSAATYSPGTSVNREQMAAFVTRTLDQSLRRGSDRASLNQYWTTQGANNLALTTVGLTPQLVQSDRADLWVANLSSGTVSRVRASDGKLLDTWTGADHAFGVLCAMGKVFVTGATSPGNLYQIDPTQPAGAVTTLSSSLGFSPFGIAYDGQRIWTANFSASVSIITLNPTTVTTVSTGFTGSVSGVIYDGANIWVTDYTTGTADKLRKLDSSGNIVQSVDVGRQPNHPAFDGTNIWVPNVLSDTVSVVRVKDSQGNTLASPFVLATLSGNGLHVPTSAAFDG